MRSRLEDIANFQKGFAFKSKDFIQSGVRIVKVTNLTDESIDLSSCVHIDENLAKSYGQYSLQYEDIIITTVGSWPTNPASVVGKVVKVPKDGNNSLLNQNAVRVRNNGKANQKYLYYLLRSEAFKEYIIGTAQGSANQASITQKDIKNFTYEIPQIKIQDSIAYILSTLDEKIEVNNQINKILKSMAQEIFKYWFVDFEFPNEVGEPYKSSGGEMVESELGMIPKGWQVKTLGSYIKFIKGKKPTTIEERLFKGSKLYLTIDVLNRNSVLYCCTDKMVKADMDDILMVMDGASSGTLFYGQEGVVGSTLAKIEVANTELNNEFIYCSLKFFESEIKTHTTGSAIPHTDKEYINRLKIMVPHNQNLIKLFNKNIRQIKQKITNNEEESMKLKEIRDTLLPKLMSGEIRVPLEQEGEV